jgi:predicted  nucleic acid-binding Zn-ribbon protein
MGLFGTPEPTSARFDALMEQLADLKTEIAELRGERDASSRLLNVEKQYATTKRELTDLQITFDREKEKHAREIRETEHMVGLQRKRGEFETEAAEREARLAVREENLQAQQDRFDEHVKFIEERFEQQFKTLEKLTGQILKRMPTTTQMLTVGASKNGSDD